MALAVFFLLTGTLAAEIALFGVQPAGFVGAALLAMSGISLARCWLADRLPADAPVKRELLLKSLAPLPMK